MVKVLVEVRVKLWTRVEMKPSADKLYGIVASALRSSHISRAIEPGDICVEVRSLESGSIQEHMDVLVLVTLGVNELTSEKITAFTSTVSEDIKQVHNSIHLIVRREEWFQ